MWCWPWFIMLGSYLFISPLLKNFFKSRFLILPQIFSLLVSFSHLLTFSMGMLLVIWLNSRHLSSRHHLNINNFASTHRQKCLCGSGGIQHIHQGIWEEPYPPVNWVIGIQTSVLAVNPVVAQEPAPGPLSHHLGTPGECFLRQSPSDKRAFVGVHVSIRKVLTRQRWGECVS